MNVHEKRSRYDNHTAVDGLARKTVQGIGGALAATTRVGTVNSVRVPASCFGHPTLVVGHQLVEQELDNGRRTSEKQTTYRISAIKIGDHKQHLVRSKTKNTMRVGASVCCERGLGSIHTSVYNEGTSRLCASEACKTSPTAAATMLHDGQPARAQTPS